jgi:RNA polymerase sigma-70 factor (ECF subfamily)
MGRFQNGDEDAFQEIVKRYKEPITAFALRMLNDRDKAVDVAQETFINVFTHVAGYRPMASFDGWLYRIAYNLAINEIRRRKRQPVVSLDAPARGSEREGPAFDPAHDGPDAEQSVLGSERCEIVRRCVQALPSKYRGAIVMKDMEGLTFEEIATILGCPESTVKSRVMRARRMLRQRLAPHMEGRAAARRVSPAEQGVES